MEYVVQSKTFGAPVVSGNVSSPLLRTIFNTKTKNERIINDE